MIGLLKRLAASKPLSFTAMTVAAAAAISVASSGAAQQPSEEPATAGAPPALRVVSQSQYRQIIADLFGPDIIIAGRFEPGQRPANGRLLAIGASSAGVSAAGFEQYEGIARGITSQVVGPKYRAALLPCQVADPKVFDADCAGQIVAKYGPLIYRRALRAGEAARLVATAQTAQGRLGDFYGAMSATLTAMTTPAPLL